MIDKCPLCLGANCKAAEYMTTASVCCPQNGIFCPWQQRRAFVLLFGGEGRTPSPPCWHWNGHFVFVCLMWAVKPQCQRQGQLSHRTAATIVCMFAYTCVHGPAAPRCKLCGWKCAFCLVLGVRKKKIWPGISTSQEFEMPGIFHVAFGMWVRGIKGFLKQTTSKYWHHADCLVYNENFSPAHFPPTERCLWSLLTGVTFSKSHFLKYDQKLERFHKKCRHSARL